MDSWQIQQFALQLGKHYTLIDNWFKELEATRIHYITRLPNGEKVYDELDLEVGRYILEKRTGAVKWSFAGIHEGIKDEFEGRLRPFPVEYDESNLPAPGDLRTLTTMIQTMIAQEVSTLTQQVNSLRAELPAPRDPVKERLDQQNAQIADRRVRTTLRREAIEKWNAKPAAERMIKVGLFGKMENQIARDDFIQEYTDQHYDERLKAQYGME